MKIITENKKAYFDYEIYEKFEAGIELLGIEVKSIKLGKINIVGGYATISGGEIQLINCEIQPFQGRSATLNYNPKRNRRLLLHKSQIKYLIGKMTQHFLLIPLKVYLKNNLIKIELGLARSRKKADKRELIKKREIKRSIKKALNI